MTNKAYACEVCGNIVYNQVEYNKEFDVDYCGRCENVIDKCQHCAYLVSGDSDVWVCDKSNRICADVVEECVE